MERFKEIGYYVEYFVGGKFIGTKSIEIPDREKFGFFGKQQALAGDIIKLDNNKSIKKGQQYTTFLQIKNGRKI